MLVLSARDVRRALPFAECAAAMRDALTALVAGQVSQPLRTVVRPDGAAGTVMLMPSYRRGTDPVYALKALCLTPSNPAAGLDAHQGIVLLSAAGTGAPLAVLNASAVTEIRTAAVSAVATELLARPDADVLAIIGTGVQARSHLLAIAASRPLAEIRVAGRQRSRADAFAESVQPETSVLVRACGSAAEAVSGAGIVVTATSSPVPVLARAWLAEGTHINAVGAHTAGTRELDGETVAAAAFFADSRVSVSSESGDYLLPLAEGLISADHIRAELGEVLTGAAPGRTSAEQITVFESLGLAVEDLAAAALAYQRAVAGGFGCDVPF